MGPLAAGEQVLFGQLETPSGSSRATAKRIGASSFPTTRESETRVNILVDSKLQKEIDRTKYCARGEGKPQVLSIL